VPVFTCSLLTVYAGVLQPGVPDLAEPLRPPVDRLPVMLCNLISQVATNSHKAVLSQVASCRKEAEQQRAQVAQHQGSEQQLLAQLMTAEADLTSSQATSSKLLQKGQQLEDEVCMPPGLIG